MTKPAFFIGSIKINNMSGNAALTIGEMIQKSPKFEDQSQGTNCSIGDLSSADSYMQNEQYDLSSKSNKGTPQLESESAKEHKEEEAATGIYA
ncbi:spore germination protein [Ferdinandcohnia quinoae]|uniref:Spore germination protein n=1 Tax=Fredinandcohnia quinoae TaxID=2918902 RepID=A0AAW5EA87_9BACI|nr:spore germination protein [Fredinandcohnia sp. SECRCQ15]MCH1626797.1 spore germination protein [Fredinandcohnia sp. SECRCQ15]